MSYGSYGTLKFGHSQVRHGKFSAIVEGVVPPLLSGHRNVVLALGVCVRYRFFFAQLDKNRIQ